MWIEFVWIGEWIGEFDGWIGEFDGWIGFGWTGWLAGFGEWAVPEGRWRVPGHSAGCGVPAGFEWLAVLPSLEAPGGVLVLNDGVLVVLPSLEVPRGVSEEPFVVQFVALEVPFEVSFVVLEVPFVVSFEVRAVPFVASFVASFVALEVLYEVPFEVPEVPFAVPFVCSVRVVCSVRCMGSARSAHCSVHSTHQHATPHPPSHTHRTAETATRSGSPTAKNSNSQTPPYLRHRGNYRLLAETPWKARIAGMALILTNHSLPAPRSGALEPREWQVQ